MHLDHRAHHVDQAREVGDVVVGEARAAVGGEGDDGHRPVAADAHRQGKIVGAAVGLHIAQRHMIALADVLHAVAHRAAVLAGLLHRAADIGRGELDAVGAGQHLHLLAAPPHATHRRQLRMDELQADIDAPQRNARLDHADSSARSMNACRRRHEAALVHQPFERPAARRSPAAEAGVQEPTHHRRTSSDEVRKTLLVERSAILSILSATSSTVGARPLMRRPGASRYSMRAK